MKSKKLKISLLVISVVIILPLLVLGGVFLYYYSTNDFDNDKLLTPDKNAIIFDNEENIVRQDSSLQTNSVSLKSLPSYIPNAFVNMEDKRFYFHNGIDYKRLIGATLINLKNKKFKQGGSTISQQLIKNTHLDGKRTLQRKFKEIAITKKMEKKLSKDNILENYLNIVYFGNNCYGIENASNYYFSKSAKDLTIIETASLVACLSAPSYYSPTANIDKNTQRRNLVLKAMQECGTISPDEYQKLITEKTKLNVSKSAGNRLNSYTENALDEASTILNLEPNEIIKNGYKIHTYLDKSKQTELEAILNGKSELDKLDYESIYLNTKQNSIGAYAARSNYKLMGVKRQPGSIIKPILVYAPAIEEKLITPASIILDEELDINGYKPKNVGGKYYGNVSVREALSRSLNIPAIKIMSYTGIEKSKNYAKKCGLNFDTKDDNYAIALGGLTQGDNLLKYATSFGTLSNDGKYGECTFIKYITNSNGKIVYRHKPKNEKIFSEDTSFLINSMLKTCAKFGTAKKLSSLNFDVCAKTGTVGDTTGNSDAYALAYTTDCIIATWIGDVSNGQRHQINGGGLPCTVAKEFLAKLYKSDAPKPFLIPENCAEIELDLLDYNENNILTKANTFTPDRYKLKEVFSLKNTPEKISNNFIKIDAPTLKYENGTLSFSAKNYLEYDLYFNDKNNQPKLMETFKNTDGLCKYYIDKNKSKNQNYYLVAKMINYSSNVEVISEKSNIIILDFSNDKNVYDDNWMLKKAPI